MFQRHSRAEIKQKQAKGKQAAHSLLHHLLLPDFRIESYLVRSSHRSKSASTKYSWIEALSIIVHILFSSPLKTCLHNNWFKCPLGSFWKRRDWPKKALPFFAQTHLLSKKHRRLISEVQYETIITLWKKQTVIVYKLHRALEQWVMYQFAVIHQQSLAVRHQARGFV